MIHSPYATANLAFCPCGWKAEARSAIHAAELAVAHCDEPTSDTEWLSEMIDEHGHGGL